MMPNQTEPNVTTGTEHLERATQALDNDDPDSALVELNTVLALDPDNAQAYKLRGYGYAMQGNFRAAITDYTSALERAPDFETYQRRGRMYQMLNQTAEAIASYQQALAIAPPDQSLIFVRNHMGEACAQMGQDCMEHKDYAQALTWLSEALKLQPDHADHYYQRGRAHVRCDHPDEAVADFAHAIQLAPNTPTYYETLGQYYALLEEHAKAIATYTQAIQNHPAHAYFYQYRALAYKEQARFDQAIRDMEQALRLNPEIDPNLLEAIHIAADKQRRQPGQY